MSQYVYSDESANPNCFESTSGKLVCGQSCLIILNICRPPDPAITFFSKIQDILSYISTLPYDLVIMGDFNLPIDSSSDAR